MYVSVCVCVSAVACVHTHPHQQAFSLLLWNTIVRANRKSSPGASCGLIQSNTSFPPHLCMSASVCVCVCVCVSGILRGSVSEFHREGCYKNIKQRQKTNTRRHGRERNVSTLTRQESEEIKAFFCRGTRATNCTTAATATFPPFLAFRLQTLWGGRGRLMFLKSRGHVCVKLLR